MALTPEQLELATLTDDHVNQVVSGGDDDELIATLLPHIGAFKRLMDTSTSDEMDQLCARFAGFYRYAKRLEALAGGIADGSIKAPG